MSSLLSDLMPVVLRATAFVAIAWLMARAFCPIVRSPQVQRLLWGLVILQGVLLVRFEVAVDWLPAEPITVTASAQPESSSPIKSESPQFDEPTDVDSAIVYSADAVIQEAPQEAAPPPRTNKLSQNLTLWSAALWVTGMLVVLLWQIGAYIHFLRNLDIVDTPAEWEEEWQAALASNNLPLTVPLRTTTNAGPLVCGLPGRHKFIVPFEQWQSLSPTQRRTVMQHEVEHLRRGDTWKSAFVRLLALPQWFNPFAWLAVRRFEDCAEWACDDATRAALPDAMSEYSRALLALGHHQPTTPSLASAASGRQLVERIQRVLTPSAKEPKLMKTKIIVAVAVIASVTSLNTLRVVRAAQQKQDETRPTTSVQETKTATESTKTEPAKTEPQNKPAITDGPVQKTSPAQPVAPQTKDTPQLQLPRADEAVIDMPRVFKEHPDFKRERQQLKELIEERDGNARAMITRFQKEFGTELKDWPQEQRDEVTAFREKMQKDLMAGEAAIYLKTYRGVQKTIASFCRANGIRVVRRRESPADEERAQSEEDKNLSPNEIIQLMNNPVVFADTQPRDITDGVIKRIVEQDKTAHVSDETLPFAGEVNAFSDAIHKRVMRSYEHLPVAGPSEGRSKN